MKAGNSVSAVLRDDVRLGVLLVPLVQVIRHLVLDGLQVARVLVPTVVAVHALNVSVLGLRGKAIKQQD